MNVHTLSMYVANKPGVLGRVTAVFSRRGFNIDSLVVSQGRDPRYSRFDPCSVSLAIDAALVQLAELAFDLTYPGLIGLRFAPRFEQLFTGPEYRI